MKEFVNLLMLILFISIVCVMIYYTGFGIYQTDDKVITKIFSEEVLSDPYKRNKFENRDWIIKPYFLLDKN
ncbi:hypothetical protein [Vagococcus fluvialis]|uniref:Uncharacterized protein n=1 Tax=Vagococcus fluvialis TaxID=2738 RepID=A0A7X6I3Z6_9ENTE|nr:hypothetical protein [Vagococcus fluvialis]NKC69056.1 hypothetical protein [Vagococcus fluvialis]